MRDPVEHVTTGAFWPSVIQQESRGERVYDLPSRLLRERIIFITGPIDDTVAASICMQLLFLEAENPKKEISMYINSPGGIKSLPPKNSRGIRPKDEAVSQGSSSTVPRHSKLG